ncbi:unnamed protein product [Lampetra fluviatilis]
MAFRTTACRSHPIARQRTVMRRILAAGHRTKTVTASLAFGCPPATVWNALPSDIGLATTRGLQGQQNNCLAMEEERTPEDTAKMEAEQLRIEVKLTREKISKVAPDILAHVESNMADDPLVKGVPEDKNPFKEKGGCVIS